MNNIDRIFSDALESHSTPTPTGLWDRVAPGLPAATSRLAWMRWAAIVVPVVAAVGMWMNRPEEHGSRLAAEQPVVSPTPAATVPIPVKEESVAALTPRQPKIKKSIQANPTASTQPIQAVESRIVEELPTPEEITIEPVVLEAETVAAKTEAPKPIVLVYTLESVAAPDDAARKETSLERVVEFARTVKHSDPVGDIRGLKDELFAFDFRKKQTKKN